MMNFMFTSVVYFICILFFVILHVLYFELQYFFQSV